MKSGFGKRVSIRSLLVLTAVTAIWFAIRAQIVHSIDAQNRRVTGLAAAFAQLEIEYRAPNRFQRFFFPNRQRIHVSRVKLAPQHSRYTAEHVQMMRRAGTFPELDGSFCRFSDDAFSELTNDRDLKFLKLSASSISKEMVESIARIEQLDTLDLSGTSVADDSVLLLAGHQNLRVLNLRGTGVSDQSLSVLRSIPRLEEVNLINTAVSEPAAENFAQESKVNVKCVFGPCFEVGPVQQKNRGMWVLAEFRIPKWSQFQPRKPEFVIEAHFPQRTNPDFQWESVFRHRCQLKMWSGDRYRYRTTVWMKRFSKQDRRYRLRIVDVDDNEYAQVELAASTIRDCFQ